MHDAMTRGMTTACCSREMQRSDPKAQTPQLARLPVWKTEGISRLSTGVLSQIRSMFYVSTSTRVRQELRRRQKSASDPNIPNY
eukprot:scaffold2007_cov123-Isochrysis_galbana.AAC.1